jgi:hypothetical protein
MGKVEEYTFKQWLQRNKIKSIVYSGEHKNIYGKRSDFPNYQASACKFHDITQSDFQQINARGFLWYDFFLPKFKKVEEGSTRVHYVRGEHGHDDQIIYNIEAPELGKQLMTEMFKTHENLLESAIRMCALSLTSEHWSAYGRDHAEWLKTVPEVAFRRERVRDVDTYGRAWGRGFWDRPTVLLEEPAIEVLVHKSETHHPQGFHVDDVDMCFPGEQHHNCSNYGMATILLPASRRPRDRVAIQMSGSESTWPGGSEDGVFVPSNVLYQDARLYQDEPREVYMIQLLANGMPHNRNGVGEHICKDVKAFRMTLSELNYIKASVSRNLKRIRQNMPNAVLPRATHPLMANMANPYTINAPRARTNAMH